MVRVGLVGCGTIGSQLAFALERRYNRWARLVALHDRDPARAAALQQQLRTPPPVRSLASLIHHAQLIVEAASADIALDVVRRALRAHKDVLVMSVGGLLPRQRWQPLVRRSRGRVYLPSGALVGLDGVKAMALGRVRRVALTSRKPPQALREAAYVRRRGIRLESLRAPRLIFEGSAEAAVKAFPQNVNVAATLTLASGLSGRAVRVNIVADPTIRRNRHEIEIEGDCGRLQAQVESRPSRNPKTSELAIRSAIAMLGRILEPVMIGT